MILQKLTFQNHSEQTKKLYYIGDDKIVVNNNVVCFQQGAEMSLETYFNLFSAEKWKKFTMVESVYLMLEFQGELRISVFHTMKRNEKLEKKLLFEEMFCSGEKMRKMTQSISLPEEGVLSVKVRALQDSRIYEGYYGTVQKLESQRIKIGIGICTFKREAYVKRNMKLLTEKIFENAEALSNQHVTVCISDNAGTLNREEIERPGIRIVQNKNLGGVGGFTRSMLEHINGQEDVTHVLLMDDDAIISSDAIERTYVMLALLKEKYREYLLGGSLLRLDKPIIQYECGACWNDGDIAAINHDLDLSNFGNAVQNECEQSTEYAGWWYCCIPVSFIKNKKLPLPFFIHRDDIEYGLRANGKFIFLNGVCVWHEAFENKLPGFLEYYDVRNLAITNAIHNAEYGAKEFKKMLFVQVSSNIGKYRYRYVDLNLKGAVDFLKGFRWFYELDTLQLHAGLSQYNYQVEDKGNFIGYHGITEEDLNPIECEEAPVPGKLIKLWRMGSMNGHFFPSKRGKTKVARPNPNIYDLYRCREVVYADNTGKAICVRRSVKELLLSYMKLMHTCFLIDKYYEKAKTDYQKNYIRLVSEEFWKRYLEIN